MKRNENSWASAMTAKRANIIYSLFPKCTYSTSRCRAAVVRATCSRCFLTLQFYIYIYAHGPFAFLIKKSHVAPIYKTDVVALSLLRAATQKRKKSECVGRGERKRERETLRLGLFIGLIRFCPALFIYFPLLIWIKQHWRKRAASAATSVYKNRMYYMYIAVEERISQKVGGRVQIKSAAVGCELYSSLLFQPALT